MLAEKLRRAREQCKEDERAIEEHQIKVRIVEHALLFYCGWREGTVCYALPGLCHSSKANSLARSSLKNTQAADWMFAAIYYKGCRCAREDFFTSRGV